MMRRSIARSSGSRRRWNSGMRWRAPDRRSRVAIRGRTVRERRWKFSSKPLVVSARVRGERLYLLRTKARAEFGGDLAMAADAQRPDIRQVAFPAALNHGDDVVGVPETRSLTGTNAPLGPCGRATGLAQAPQPP